MRIIIFKTVFSGSCDEVWNVCCRTKSTARRSKPQKTRTTKKDSRTIRENFKKSREMTSFNENERRNVRMSLSDVEHTKKRMIFVKKYLKVILNQINNHHLIKVRMDNLKK